ncbi:unnamed protein product [Linum tenue]|uniref:Uncharacterized protein n=1 Tax=Linum tenue TaxID=586396 RepID=A0AAV0KSI2_9ROSI|nr:unnamed protein product [Linum tenue]
MRKSWEINIHAKGSGGYRFGFKARLAETRGSKLRTRFPLLSRLYDSFVEPTTTAKDPKSLHRFKPSSPSTSRSKHHRSKKHKNPEPEQIPISPPKIDSTASPYKVSRFIPRSRSLPNPENGTTLFDGAKPKQDNDNGLGSSIVRSVKSLSRSIEERSWSGILIHGWCVALFAWLLLMERFGILKWRNLAAVLVVAVVAWGVASRNVVGSADEDGGGQGRVQEAWKFTASSGSLDQLSMVVFSRIRQAVGL